MSTEENHSNTDESISKPLIAETKICSICLLSGSTDDNDPIVYCDRCGIIVHESCYNADALDDKSSESSSPSEYWFCTPCLSRVDDPICALCPTKDRCSPFWPTLESSWIHVVCALGVPGVLFYDELYYTPVDISNIPSQKFGNKACHLCESRSGVTVSCDAGLCPNAFHLSCANKNGLLQIRGELSKIECELYCVTHQSSSNTYKVVQRNYTICEVQQKQLDQREKLNDDIAQTLADHWTVYRKRTDSFPRLPKPIKSHLPRSLIVDPIALKNFFDKAQRLRSKESNPSTNHLDLASTDTNALLAFAGNEQELIQLRQRIQEMENKLQQLDSSENDKQLKDEHRKLENELKKEYEILSTLTERYHLFLEVFKHYNCPLKDETISHLSNIKSPQLSSSISTETDSCSVCHQIDRSNQMIKCCQCHLAFHGDCLTPPMPTKTLSLILSASKKYEWQCASCVNAQQEQLDQCHVNVDQPRQIRPRRTNELVLRESVIKFGSRKRKQENNEETSDSKKTKVTLKESKKKKRDDDKATTSRTSVIQQLFTKNTTDFTPESSKRTPSPPKKSTTDDTSRSSVTPPARSKSLTIDRRTPTIFKQKALSLPMTKPEKKKRQTKKDPMSIFDFDDEDDATGNGTTNIGLRSSITPPTTTTTEQNEPIKKKVNRRSTTTIKNEIPSDALCKECSKSGSDQTMTDCDQCKHFYHFACCSPPLASFPKRRNYGWTCHRCDEPSDDDEQQHSSTKVNKRERKMTNRASEKDLLNEN